MSGATEAFSHVRIPDVNPEFGQPVISNGLLLSKIHHAAFCGPRWLSRSRESGSVFLPISSARVVLPT